MLAHYHGQTWNAATLASSLGLSQPTVRSYLDLMTSVFMVRQLQPWHAVITITQSTDWHLFRMPSAEVQFVCEDQPSRSPAKGSTT